jgi:hypothetical protein
MDDAGPGNKAVGHRRWIMYPPQVRMGNGMTSTSNALTVLGAPIKPARPNPAWVGWPTAGWFPAPLEPAGRWSLSSGDDGARFARAKVSVTGPSGERLRVHRFPIQDGYGKPTVVFRVRGIAGHGAYRVTVRGIRLPDRATPVRHTYTVRLFQRPQSR